MPRFSTGRRFTKVYWSSRVERETPGDPMKPQTRKVGRRGEAMIAAFDQRDGDIGAGQTLGETRTHLPRHRRIGEAVQQAYRHVERDRRTEQ